MMTTSSVLAIRVPAPCFLDCEYCCSPAHIQGDPKAVYRASIEAAKTDKYRRAYVTSTGDTGQYVLYPELVGSLQAYGIEVCPLGMTKQMLMTGMPWAEISVKPKYPQLADAAVREARERGTVPIGSTVWCGETDLELMADTFDFDAILHRSLRAEGASNCSGGESIVWRRPGVDLKGWMPIKAYRGLEQLDGITPYCIDTFGNHVELFVGDSVRPQ